MTTTTVGNEISTRSFLLFLTNAALLRSLVLCFIDFPLSFLCHVILSSFGPFGLHCNAVWMLSPLPLAALVTCRSPSPRRRRSRSRSVSRSPSRSRRNSRSRSASRSRSRSLPRPPPEKEGTRLGAKTLRRNQPTYSHPSSRCLYVGNLPYSTNARDIEDLFRKCSDDGKSDAVEAVHIGAHADGMEAAGIILIRLH